MVIKAAPRHLVVHYLELPTFSMADLQDDELYLPRSKLRREGREIAVYKECTVHLLSAAVVNKLIKEMVPNLRVSTDARDLLLNCCSG